MWCFFVEILQELVDNYVHAILHSIFVDTWIKFNQVIGPIMLSWVSLVSLRLANAFITGKLIRLFEPWFSNFFASFFLLMLNLNLTINFPIICLWAIRNFLLKKKQIKRLTLLLIWRRTWEIGTAIDVQ